MSTSYRQPEFLSDADYPLHRIRCPVHGFIHVSDNERTIISHSLVSRLRYIRQLALTEFVYPGAVHTRFEHSLGVMEVASKAFDSLSTRYGDLLESSFRQVPFFHRRPMALARQLLRMSALLHDVGHASFSHAAEEVVNDGEGHEKLTVRIVKNRQLLGSLLDKTFGNGFADQLAEIIDGTRLAPQLVILKNLVSGEMDADRTDYLLRDSYHCGVEYGHFDHRWMLECLELQVDKFGGLEIALNRDGLHTFEALILARYYMNTHVYQHRVRRIYDYYLRKYFASSGGIKLRSESEILKNNDVTMLSKIFCDAQATTAKGHIWASRIRDREHHKLIHETGLGADTMDLKRSAFVLESLNERYPELDFVPDTASAAIHKIYIPGDDEIKTNLVLFCSDGQRRPVGQESQVLKSLPRRFQCARIFCSLENKGTRLRREVEKYANNKWNSGGGR